MYQALYRKWRSRTFDQVVGQGHVTQTLKRQVQSGRLSHAYLFTGTRGTGKTSCAKLLARAVNCEHPVDGNPCNACPSCLGIENGSIMDVWELDAASNNRVDDIRSILDEAVYTPGTVKKRVYIIDEVHMLSAQAFNALLQILEEPPEHLMFILATTEIHKVPATIKSRCQQFSFKRIRASDIAGHLLHVAGEEDIDLTDSGAALIARLADGGMRDALSLLDQCSGGGGTVDESRVYDCLGLAGNLETAHLFQSAVDGDTEAALGQLNKLYAGGREMTALAGELAALARDLLVRKTAPKSGTELMTGGFDGETLKKLSGQLDVPRLVQMLALLQRTAADLTRSANRRTDMELCLLTLCDPSLDESSAGLSARIAQLEQGVTIASKRVQVPRRETPPPEAVPWDEPPLPEEPPERDENAVPDLPWDEAPVPKAGPGPEPSQSAPAARQPSKPAPTAGGHWPGWPAFCAQLKGTLAVSDYSFVNNASMTEGRWDGRELTLWVANEFLRDMLDKTAITRPMAELMQRLTGAEAQIVVRVGQAPAEAPNNQSSAQGPTDALDAFLAQGGSNIIVE